MMSSGSETSFHSYTFNYQWTVNHLGARLYHPEQLVSPTFNSPEGAKPVTKWQLVLVKDTPTQGRQLSFSTASSEGPVESYVSLRLERLSICTQGRKKYNKRGDMRSHPSGSRVTMNQQPIRRPTQEEQEFLILQSSAVNVEGEQQEEESDIWIEACLKTVIVYQEKRQSVTSQSKEPTQIQPPQYFRFKYVTFSQCISTSKLLDSLNVTFDCEVKVWLLDNPIHMLHPIHVPEFNLGKIMDENRRKNLYTDVTLVAAGKKEFRAHKAVIASQSDFFKTKFAERWQDQKAAENNDKVELTDIPGAVMEAMLSYMYTGKVAAIEEMATSVLPFAEEYGLEGLRKTCEQVMAKSLTTNNAVDLLITANAHNALDLKKACMDYISSNVVSVKKSEGWKKLKQKQDCHDLCIELLEKITD